MDWCGGLISFLLSARRHESGTSLPGQGTRHGTQPSGASALQVGAKMLTACQRLQRNVAAATAGGSTPQVALTEYNVYAAACVRVYSF